MSLALGIPLSIALFFGAEYVFRIVNQDPNVIQLGGAYLKIRAIGLVPIGLLMSYRGYWNATNRPHVYMRTLVVMHVVNLVTSYVFIFGVFGLDTYGVRGAAIGTTGSLWLGVILYMIQTRGLAREEGYLKHMPSRIDFRSLLSVSIPFGIQQTLFAGGLTTLYWIIGQISTTDLAAANIVVNVMLVGILPCIGLGMAATTLVGQAVGRQDPEDAERWGHEVVQVALVVMCVLGVILLIFPESILAVFTSELHVRAAGTAALQITLFVLLGDAVGLVYMNALFGVGESKRVALISVGLQWLFFLPLAYLIGPVMGGTLTDIWICQFIYRVMNGGFMWFLWRRHFSR